MTAAGVYLHIPFCRSRCSYCDFATGLYETETATRYVAAITREIKTWKEIDPPEFVDTIYFGGGTPSLLSPDQIETILTSVRQRFDVSPESEVTMEMNPGSAGSPGNGDKNATRIVETLQEFRTAGITRVSFGAQSFNDQELAKLGRSHNANEIIDTFQNLRAAGFENISFDLIAGLPGQTLDQWHYNLERALNLRPEHLSFYLLEVHQGTPLADHIKQGKQPKPDDDLAAEMYAAMLERASEAGYEHYEISNLCLPGYESRHNSKYWTGAPYYGFGCSAHSFDGNLRRWSNVRDVNRYTELVEANASPIAESSAITNDEARSEAMYLGLRLMRGISFNEYQQRFDVDLRRSHEDDLDRFQQAGLIEIDGDVMRLTRTGALLSNEVFSAFV